MTAGTIKPDTSGNLLARIIFCPDFATREEKVATTFKALIFHSNRELSQKQQNDLKLFNEYLQFERLRIERDLKGLADSDVTITTDVTTVMVGGTKVQFSRDGNVTVYTDGGIETRGADPTVPEGERKNLRMGADFRTAAQYGSEVKKSLNGSIIVATDGAIAVKKPVVTIEGLIEDNRALTEAYGVLTEAGRRAYEHHMEVRGKSIWKKGALDAYTRAISEGILDTVRDYQFLVAQTRILAQKSEETSAQAGNTTPAASGQTPVLSREVLDAISAVKRKTRPAAGLSQ